MLVAGEAPPPSSGGIDDGGRSILCVNGAKDLALALRHAQAVMVEDQLQKFSLVCVNHADNRTFSGRSRMMPRFLRMTSRSGAVRPAHTP